VNERKKNQWLGKEREDLQKNPWGEGSIRCTIKTGPGGRGNVIERVKQKSKNAGRGPPSSEGGYARSEISTIRGLPFRREVVGGGFWKSFGVNLGS